MHELVHLYYCAGSYGDSGEAKRMEDRIEAEADKFYIENKDFVEKSYKLSVKNKRVLFVLNSQQLAFNF